MKNETLSPDIVELENGKGDICVSVIVPTHRPASMKKEDNIKLKQAVEKAKDQLNSQYSKEEAAKLSESIDELYNRIDLSDTKDGVGIFVSKKVKILKSFQLPVKGKIIIGDSFELRDLLMEEQYSTPYYLLVLTRKTTKLYNGKMDMLTEITDKDFPKEFIDDYEYQHPSPASSYSGSRLEKSFEKDKSVGTEIRAQRFMQEVDELLDKYLVRDTPLIVSAEVKDLAYFRKITRHQNKIAGDLKGSYASSNPKELGALAWPVMINYLEESEDKIIEEFKELPPGRVATGLENSWKAVAEGQGFKLLVERDFDRPAYLDTTGFTLYLQPPQTKHSLLSDAVDDLIEKSFQMKTEVIFVQNDKLKGYQRIALIKRY